MKPDFRTWAENIVLLAQAHGTGTEEIERALMQSYDQGYHFGLHYGWSEEQDKEYSPMDFGRAAAKFEAGLACDHQWNPNLDVLYCKKCGETG